jgi:hypothetical protein
MDARRRSVIVTKKETDMTSSSDRMAQINREVLASLRSDSSTEPVAATCAAPAEVDPLQSARRKADSARSHASAAVDELARTVGEKSNVILLGRARLAREMLLATMDACRAALADVEPEIEAMSKRTERT